MSDTLERLCEEMHDRYEAAAAKENWQTNPLSRKPWADVPEENKATMRAAIGPIADEFDELRAALNYLEVSTMHPSMDGHHQCVVRKSGKLLPPEIWATIAKAAMP